MTDQELLGVARQTLNMARTDWELQGWPSSMVIASYHACDEPPLHRMRKIERLLQEKLGEGWLNDDAKKCHGFYVLRLATAAMPPDAVVIVTPTNMWRPTAKFKLVGNAAKKATATRERRDQLVAEGRLELIDSVTAVAQTPERVCTCMQPVERGVYVGAPTATFFAQAEFDGRMKMFGGGVSEEDLQAVQQLREALQALRRERKAGANE